MPDNVDIIRNLYNGDPGREESRLDRHQLERDLTLRYFENYLPSAGRILEIGAATGVYTLWLAQRGYHVTAVDLSEQLVARCRNHIETARLSHRVTCHTADALNLASVPGDNFDAVFLMGPLYHLSEVHNRLAAIQQAAARLKPAGIFASALISRLGILGNLLRDLPAWIDKQSDVQNLLQHGLDSPATSFHGYFASIEEIAPLHEQAGLKTIILASTEPAISADDNSYNRLTGPQRDLWLNLLYKISTNPNLIASSRHLLYLARKPEQ